MSQRVAIIDYGMGNLHSVENAFRRAGGDPRVVARPAEAERADLLALPGVGALEDCSYGLENAGFADFVRGWIREDRPFVGICLGLQALFERSEERDSRGLGVFPGQARRFASRPGLKIPHMGWNETTLLQADSPFWQGLRPVGERFYFVHSYCVVPEDPSLVLASADYGVAFVAAVARGRCVAFQFHPEKSQAKGLQLYRNAIEVAARA